MLYDTLSHNKKHRMLCVSPLLHKKKDRPMLYDPLPHNKKSPNAMRKKRPNYVRAFDA